MTMIPTAPYNPSSGTLDAYCRYAHVEDDDFVRCAHPARNKTWWVNDNPGSICFSCKRCIYACITHMLDDKPCANRVPPRMEVKNRFSTDKEAST